MRKLVEDQEYRIGLNGCAAISRRERRLVASPDLFAIRHFIWSGARAYTGPLEDRAGNLCFRIVSQGFGGAQDPLLKKLLVMIPGHEGERAYITWRRHQPEKTILLRQGTPYHEGLNNISERENKLLLSMSGNVCLYQPRLSATTTRVH